jgi:hypothetical protein
LCSASYFISGTGIKPGAGKKALAAGNMIKTGLNNSQQ